MVLWKCWYSLCLCCRCAHAIIVLVCRRAQLAAAQNEVAAAQGLQAELEVKG